MMVASPDADCAQGVICSLARDGRNGPQAGKAVAIMKAVIPAGGLGTRTSEKSHLEPRPIIEIGGLLILRHVMTSYGAGGVTDSVICRGEMVTVGRA